MPDHPLPGAGYRRLRHRFESRDDLVAYCREVFPEAAVRDAHVSPMRGGTAAAAERLAAVDGPRYGKTRNHLDGAVTRLSPYLRHGVLPLASVRDDVVARFSARGAYKLVQELCWRDYWQRVWDRVGDGVHDDREPYKTGWSPDDYADELPPDVREARTGIDFVDAMAEELHHTGYLHNQARMKLASYVVHWRRVKWQAGARWFIEHLLDGDVASNHLSWQWVASTFGSKPYIFNEENLVKVTDGAFQGVADDGSAPFRGSYEALAARLFPRQGGDQ